MLIRLWTIFNTSVNKTNFHFRLFWCFFVVFAALVGSTQSYKAPGSRSLQKVLQRAMGRHKHKVNNIEGPLFTMQSQKFGSLPVVMSLRRPFPDVV